MTPDSGKTPHIMPGSSVYDVNTPRYDGMFTPGPGDGTSPIHSP